MFNKQFTRFLCFFVCFCLCFAWFGEPMEAKASGVALLGVVIMFLIGSGIAFSIKGMSFTAGDALLNYVEEYMNNGGPAAFWEIVRENVTVGPTGALLLKKDAVDVLNGFVNWLQSDKGWNEGSEHDFSLSVASWPAMINGIESTAKSCLVSFDSSAAYNDLTYSRYFISEEGTLLPFSTGSTCLIHTMYKSIGVPDGYSSYFYLSRDYNTNLQLYYSSSSGQVTKSFTSFHNSFKAFGLQFSDIVGLTFAVLDSGSLYFGVYDGDGYFYPIRSYSECLVLDYNESSVTCSVPDQLTSPDTTDWSDVYSLALHGGVSGSIPASIDDYNDQIISSLNEGVVPDVTTEVVVDQSGEIETDGTLLGFVQGIFDLVSSIPLQLSRIWESVKAIPETIIDGILTGVKSIFIPDPEDMNDQFMVLLEEINDKYSFNFDLDTLFSGEKEPEDITAEYSAGSLSWNLTFVSWHYLKKGVQHFRPFIRGFIVLMLLFYNLRQFMAIFGLGGVMNGDSADRRVNDLAV